jgi:hypothetical protein
VAGYSSAEQEPRDQDNRAENVVVAMANFQKPRASSYAGDLAPEIAQLHSSEYRNLAALAEGRVLIVGAGQSGAEIAWKSRAVTEPRSREETPAISSGCAPSSMGGLLWRPYRQLRRQLRNFAIPLRKLCRVGLLHAVDHAFRLLRSADPPV